MKYLLLFILLSWLSITYAHDSKSPKKQETPGFIATFPASVIIGSKAKFCIRFEDLKDDVDVVVGDDEPHAFKKFELKIDDKNPNVCVDVEISKEFTENTQKTITINGQNKKKNYVFSDSKLFRVKAVDHFTMIETDKAVYKPGQRVNIRIVTLDFNLMTRFTVFPLIYITDPSGSRIRQWINLFNDKGIIDLNLPLSKDPNLGNWQIVAVQNEKTQYTAQFEVKKYVLPKFEVKINNKESIFIDEKSVSVDVCAVYSFGANVKGLFEIYAYTKVYSYEQQKEITGAEFRSSISAKGCNKFQINLAALKIPGKDYVGTIYYEASVKEEGTDVKASASSQASITYYNTEINLIEPNYYKPGLPIRFKIELKSISDLVYKNDVKIQLSQGNQKFYERVFKVNQKNMIEFTFDPDQCVHCKTLEFLKDKPPAINLAVIPINKVALPADAFNAAMLTEDYEKRDFQILPWFSPSASYLQIYDESSKIMNCGERLKLRLRLKSLKHLPNRLNLQLQGRSNVLASLIYSIDKLGRSRDFDIRVVSNYLIPNCDLTIRLVDTQKFKFLKFKDDSQTILYNCYGLPISQRRFEYVEEFIYEHIFDVSFNVESEMTPELKVLAFIIENDEIIADSLNVQLNKCFDNKVQITFDKRESRVNSNVQVRLQTDPRSLCAFSAVDKSVTFLGKRSILNIDKVFDELNQFELDIDYDNTYASLECKNENQNNGNIDVVRPIPLPIVGGGGGGGGFRRIPLFFGGVNFYDATRAFRDSSVIYLSDYKIFSECFQQNNDMFLFRRAVAMENVATTVAKAINTVRKYFPETWIWDLRTSDDKGLVIRNEKTPDTITDWIFDAYCISHKKGLGIANTNTLKVFQPLFVSMDLPYSVVKGQEFPVKVTVFNFESTCLPISLELVPEAGKFETGLFKFETCVCEDDKVTKEFRPKAIQFSPFNGDGFKLVARLSNSNNRNLCNANQRISKTLTFSDSEERKIIVEPNGLQFQEDKSVLIVHSESKISNEILSFVIKPIYNQDSVRATFSIIGDSIGSAITNLDNLVRQPYGCGEQNMINFSPLNSIADYLKFTDQLTPKIREQIIEYLLMGYQKELTFRHPDGSFSAFGPGSSQNGGTWLTAFVLRCFAEVKESNYIQIDDNDILVSFKALMDRQDADGSFRNEGDPLIHKALAGNINDRKSAFCAYITLALLKSFKFIKTDQMTYSNRLNSAIGFIKSSISNLATADTYTLALTLYILKLSNDNSDLYSRIDAQLKARAKKPGNFVYWSDNSATPNLPGDLEITAYILLAKLYSFDNKDLDEVVKISKWINSQRNSLGGCYSTQDTIIAIQALAEFSKRFFIRDMSMTCQLSSLGQMLIPPGKFVRTIKIDKTNRLLLQTFEFDVIKDSIRGFRLECSGIGSVLAHVNLKYYINPLSLIPSNQIVADIDPSSPCSKASFKIQYPKAIPTPTGSMTILEIKPPGGYQIVESSLESIKNSANSILKKYETLSDYTVNLYVEQVTEVGKFSKQFEITFQKVFNVSPASSGSIYSYDYYDVKNNGAYKTFAVSDCSTIPIEELACRGSRDECDFA